MNMARRDLQKRTGIILRWIPDLVRSYPRPAAKVAQWAASSKARDGGVVALGLGGPEAGFPASNFRKVFDMARDANLPANPHAGEGDGPLSIWKTIESLKPARIGHGVRAIEDPQLVMHIASLGMPLEVCLTSNVRLGVYPSYEEHPVRQLLDAGCIVTLNTDDPVLFQTNLTDEYFRAFHYCGLSIQDIRNAIISAIRGSHQSTEERDEMCASFRNDFECLN